MMKIIVPILILFVWKSLALYLPTYFLSLYLINLSVATELNESEQQIQQYFKLAREYR